MSTIEITIDNTKVALPANLDATFEVNGVKISVNTTPTTLPNVPKTNTNQPVVVFVLKNPLVCDSCHNSPIVVDLGIFFDISGRLV